MIGIKPMTYQIKQEKMTDGSSVYDVHLYDEYGSHIVFHCTSEQDTKKFIRDLDQSLFHYTLETLIQL